MRASCICEYLTPIRTKTRFIILMHPKEYKKEKNGSGRMTNLQLENSELIVGVDFSDHTRVNEILTEENSSSFLLYPGKNNFNLSVRNSKETSAFLGDQANIFILDGTWPCARKMLKLSTNLQQLQRVSFDNTIQSKFIIKQQPESLCLSTIESVYTVLNLLKNSNVEHCETKDFLIPFEKMIEHQVECITNPNNKSYRTGKKREIVPKTRYKNNAVRNTIFEQTDINEIKD